MSNLKQAIKQQYLKCAQDPSYFMNKFCLIQHPQRGKIKFELYSFQEEVLKEYQEHDYNIILLYYHIALLLYCHIVVLILLIL